MILPGLSALEQPHYDDLIWSWAVRSVGQLLRRRASRRRPTARASGRSSPRLAAMLRRHGPAEIDVDDLDDGYFSALCEAKGVGPAPTRPAAWLRPDGARSGCSTCRSAPAPFGDRYGEHPGGLTLAAASRTHPTASTWARWCPACAEVLRTPDGRRIDLAPDYITADLPRLAARLGPSRSTRCVLVSRRHLRSNNSWMHNVTVLVKGKDRCTLLIHPRRRRAGAESTDARRRPGDAPRPARSRSRSR